MADLIDRGKAILSLYGIETNAEGTIPFRAAVFAIRHTPSAEQTSAERHSRRKVYYHGENSWSYVCEACGMPVDEGDAYCRGCGSKMEE